MQETNASVQTRLRIPGDWAHPGELIERMPDGFRLTPEALSLPDGTEIEVIPMPPDGQFAQIFESSCRQPATDDELAAVNRYSVNVGLCGPGGSLAAASKMMQAGAALVRAGGAGVFIDNCGLAHGGGLWIEMADDPCPDALSFAFVGIVNGKDELWTMGMHVLGYPEFVMRHTDTGDDADTIINIIRSVCSGDKPIGDGHVLVDERSPCFQTVATTPDDFDPGSPFHNPFGRLKLVSTKEIASGN